ncbi:zinc finger protein 287-like [Ochlerotatus camptorhynchus]|uniref:zinc finger protein 287-like n=1 Tax=Ochlerotatus camptorhynchus TaxID=644619 RepID=UPI0031E03A2F
MAAEACEIKKETSAESICRLCFTERENYRLIFVDEYSSLHAWIENLTSLKIMKVPNAPGSLCLECENTLHNFESFREMCFTNDRVFTEVFTQDNRGNDRKVVSNFFPATNEIKMELSEGQKADVLNLTIDENFEIKLECPDLKIAATSIVNSEENDESSNGAEEDQTLKTNECHMEPIAEECNTFLNSLNRQIQMDNKEKPHICSWCNKGFRRSNQLKVHIRSHTQERPYMCNDCDKSFSTLSNLVRHARSPNGCKPYTCDLCKARFSHSSHLMRHKLVHSKEIRTGTTIFTEETESNRDK